MLGVLLAAPLAGAQHRGGDESFGDRGQFIVSADRLFELFAYQQYSFDEFTPNGGDNKTVQSVTQTSVGLFWGSTFIQGAQGVQNVYAVPRLGFDYTIVNNVTVGGELIAFFTIGGSNNTEHDRANTSVTDHNGQPGFTTFGAAVRGGYILQMSDTFAFWFRGGFSDYAATQKSTNTFGNVTTEITLGYKQFAIDVDPKVVWTPFRHVGFTAGLTADIPIGGEHWSDTNVSGPNMSASQHSSAPSSFAFVGVTMGTLVWF
jgi:hypothetical protein